mgnify:CR=1 FL=1
MVQESFKFLIEEYGFRTQKLFNQTWITRFRKHGIVIEICCDGENSRELSLSVLKANPFSECDFDIHDLALMIPGVYPTPHTCSNFNYEGLQSNLNTLANDLQLCIDTIIKHHKKLFKAALAIQSLEDAVSSTERQIKSIRAKADQAWEEKDYLQVIEEYEKLGTQCSESEVMKMEYALKQVH